jgi:hypothetical protein
VEASSVHEGEFGESPATALVDGDLATRWSSEYEEPQQILVTLRKAVNAEAILLHWENACATRYAVAVSSDGETWRPIHLYLNADAAPKAREDRIRTRGAAVKAIKIDLMERVNTDWGFSLYEIELQEAR